MDKNYLNLFHNQDEEIQKLSNINLGMNKEKECDNIKEKECDNIKEKECDKIELNDENKPKKKKKSKKKKNRCFVCNKKLGLIPFSCKCDPNKQFCSQHRFAESHNCNYDWKADGIQKLMKNNPQIVADKWNGEKIG